MNDQRDAWRRRVLERLGEPDEPTAGLELRAVMAERDRLERDCARALKLQEHGRIAQLMIVRAAGADLAERVGFVASSIDYRRSEREALEIWHQALALAKFERRADLAGRRSANENLAMLSAEDSYFAGVYLQMWRERPTNPLLASEWCWIAGADNFDQELERWLDEGAP